MAVAMRATDGFLNELELVWTIFRKPIMRRFKNGYFEHIGYARGVLVKRTHMGQVWYHYPEDYLTWRHPYGDG